ncbi:hypothetical protein [Flagellimonas sp. W118]|uniref:hypothetical protein n=1 Tax=Flagellimonas sp. W118 TaxID=3410791 RepID=UPI003BF5E89C
MSNLKSIIALLGIGLILGSCDPDSVDAPLVLNAGTLSGGPFTFTVDGTPDMVSGITLDESDVVGLNRGYIITDDSDNILGLPPTLDAVEGVDFDGAGAGICFIWHIVYEAGLSGLEAGNNVADLSGEYELSNSIMVTRNGLNAGTLSGGPFTFTVDGTPDMVSGIELDATDLNGTNQTYVITDDQNNILGLPPTLEAVEGVDFDGAGAGVCLIWHLTYEDGLTGLEAGNNVSDFTGNYALSNSITVTRNGLNAGTISGGPFTFTVDGTPDMVSGIELDDTNLNGSKQRWVITDDKNNILGLPPTLEAVEGVDFDGAGVGVCLIWHLTYEEGLTGLEAGNNVSDLKGDYALSNSITVTRNDVTAGEISGGPFTFTVDGTPDMVSGITLDDTNVTGPNQGWVITDDKNNILGLPPTLDAVEGVDFDGAGAGVCLIWHITYGEGLTGLTAGNNVSDLEGPYALSNSITVTRNALDAGYISGGPFTFTVDGTSDMVSGINLDATNLNGSKQGWVITDDKNNILGLPPTLDAVEGVDFDGAGAGVCLIWHITYEEGLTGLEAGNNVSGLNGYYALSNSLTVTRNALNAGYLSGGPYYFVVDGTPDMVSAVALDDTELNGSNQTWVITDDKNNILGLPPTLDAVKGVDFDAAGPGTCFIWHLTYEDGLTGLSGGNNVSDLSGYYALSNSVKVVRSPLNAGYISGGPFTFKVDGTPDMVYGITLDDSELNGSKQGWVITDEYNNILGLPPTLEAVEGVDFDAAGVGICFIWHITYEEGLNGLAAGNNVSDLDGFYDLSNSIKVKRELPH